MPTLTLDDDELRALCDLLTDVMRQPNRFPLSPKRRDGLTLAKELIALDIPVLIMTGSLGSRLILQRTL